MANFNLGFVLDTLERYDEAEETYRHTASLSTTYPQDPTQQLTGIVSAMCYLGRLYLRHGRYEVCINCGGMDE